MLADVQSSYGLASPFHGAGNFETEHQRNLVREVCAAVQTGRLIVVSGLVGSPANLAWMIGLPVAVGMAGNVGWGRRCFMAMALLGVSVIVGTLIGVNFTSYG